MAPGTQRGGDCAKLEWRCWVRQQRQLHLCARGSQRDLSGWDHECRGRGLGAFDVTGRQMQTGQLASDTNGNSRLGLLAPGTYRLQIASSGGAIGSYSFQVLDLATATQIADSTAVNVTLEPGSRCPALSSYRRTLATASCLIFSQRTPALPKRSSESSTPGAKRSSTRLAGRDLVWLGPQLSTGGTYTILLEGRDPGTPAVGSFTVRKRSTLESTLPLGQPPLGASPTRQSSTTIFSISTPRPASCSMQSRPQGSTGRSPDHEALKLIGRSRFAPA